MQRPIVFILNILVAVWCQALMVSAAPDWRAVAEKIVERLELGRGEKVLLAVKGDRFSELVESLRRRVAEERGTDVGALDVDSIDLPDGQIRRLLEGVDVLVILPGPMPTDGLYRVMQEILREGRKRTVHFHWEGAYPLAGKDLPSPEEIDRAYEMAILETDYDSVGRHQADFEKALRLGETHVTTPLGTDLRFRVGQRPVNLQNGVASRSRADQARILIDREIELPCGVIRVAPLEESVHGVIAFPPGTWGGKQVADFKLHFSEGQVTRIEGPAATVDAVQSELEGGGGAGRFFREFALGFNPLLAVTVERPWIPYYGYGAGVVRLSLGDNSELGGKVRGEYVRWNFFTDATVSVNGHVWVKEGRLVR